MKGSGQDNGGAGEKGGGREAVGGWAGVGIEQLALPRGKRNIVG